MAAYSQVGPLWTLICSKVGPGRSGMHVRNRWRTLTRAPALPRRTSDGRPGSRERSSEAGPSRRARSTTSASAVGRNESPASRTEARCEDQPSPPIAESAASPFDFEKYYAAIASPAPHLPSVLGEAVGSSLGHPSTPFTENELAFLRAYPPPPQDTGESSPMDWTGLDNLVPPPLAPPTFPSPLSQAPMVSFRRLVFPSSRTPLTLRRLPAGTRSRHVHSLSR
jgi:hypothetical protein